MMVRVVVPATSANLGVLFDKGGVALDVFRNTIELEVGDTSHFLIEGEGEGELPEGRDNLVYRAIERFYLEIGKKPDNFTIRTYNQIPLSRGLGSSAACIAGGMQAANELEGGPLGEKDVISMAAEMEGHGDNVCACVKGGICLFEKGSYRKVPSPAAAFVIYIPTRRLDTKMSRGVLPGRHEKDAMKEAMRLENRMIAALESGDLEKAGATMERDVLHQPYRKKLIPFWDEVMEAARDAGVFGTALSGAGPSMVSLCALESVHEIASKIKSTIDKKHELSIMVSEINEKGMETGVY